MSYRVTIELDAPSSTYGVEEVASTIGYILSEECSSDIVINRINVEREDA